MRDTIKAKNLELKDVFCDKYEYFIPSYQRPYSWGRDQTQALLDDLCDALPDASPIIASAPPYFLGCIVLVKGDDPRAEVIDGQQRLTTLTIIFSALRDLATEVSKKREIEKRIIRDEDESASIKSGYHLNVRESDRQFFRDHIQKRGGIEKFRSTVPVKRGPRKWPDSHINFLRNAQCVWDHITGEKFSPEQRRRLLQFLVQRCYLVVVYTPDEESSYRIFSVLNSRGLDLSHTDILKAHIIGKLPEEQRETYAAKWEDMENKLGQSEFSALFSHIRMIFQKVKLRASVREDYEAILEHYPIVENVGEFINHEIAPYSEAYAAVSDAEYGSDDTLPAVAEINMLLRHCGRLNNRDWVPPALAFVRRFSQNPSELVRYVRNLERLAYALFIQRKNKNDRIRRYADVLKEFERKEDLFRELSKLQLGTEDKSNVRTQLTGPIDQQIMRTLLLLRINNVLAKDDAKYDRNKLTVEHVLPQDPDPHSQWIEWFSDAEERTELTHCLGNLVLLPRRRNTQARNFEFHKKKEKYFPDGKDIKGLALTNQVREEPEWTPAVVKRRREDLCSRLAKEWRL